MEGVKQVVNYMKGYQHVADFQRFCGVEVVEVGELVERNESVPNGIAGDGTENGKKGTRNGLTHRTSENKNISDSKYTTSNGIHKNGITKHTVDQTTLAYKIHNKFMFYLLSFGAGLGGEIFYIIFFPFMMWNVDSRLTRCCVLIWYPLMYLGQFLKDYIQWPRPRYPAVRLEGNRFEMEYGMPSTHTIVGTCIPFTLLYITSKEYEYPYYIGFAIAIAWTSLVACSRVYLGMHTALDCIAGISLTAFALPGMLEVVEYFDYIQVTSSLAPLYSLLIPLLACVYYPKPKVWSITRGDTSNIVSIGSLMMVATWLNYQLGWLNEMTPSDELQPLPPITLDWMKLTLLRTLIGVAALAASRVVSKKIFMGFVCKCAGVDTKDINRQRELGLEVPIRWLTIGGLAVNTTFTLPLCFWYLGIHRPGFYHEVGL